MDFKTRKNGVALSTARSTLIAMIIDPQSIDPRDMYHLLIHLITPRPIAWVSTVSVNGKTNLAPYSFFNGVSARPPAVVFCPANNREGRKKDTLVNVEAVSQFVVNIVTETNAEIMNQTASMLPYEESEFDAYGLTPVQSETVRPPRLKESPASLECRVHDIIRIGEGPLAGNMVIGVIQRIHLSRDILDHQQQLDPSRFQTVGRMGGAAYVHTRDQFEMQRPS